MPEKEADVDGHMLTQAVMLVRSGFDLLKAAMALVPSTKKADTIPVFRLVARDAWLREPTDAAAGQGNPRRDSASLWQPRQFETEEGPGRATYTSLGPAVPNPRIRV